MRVQARNLRGKLGDYYSGPGRRDPVRIELPKGHYIPVFLRASPPVADAAPPAVAPPAAVRTPSPLRNWRVTAAAICALVLGAATLLWLLVPVLWPPPPDSIAVLPFTNLSGDTEGEYFAYGFADELTAILGQQPKLRVAARTSAFHFKGTREDVRSIASQLNVAAVLEGSLQGAGGRVKVTAQLIDGRSGYHLWARTLERARSEAPIMLTEIAAGVTQVLHVTAPPSQRRPAAPEVEALYLQGTYLRTRPDDESRQRGLESLEEAVRKDPQFTPALASLAYIYAGNFYHGAQPRASWVEKAKTAARRALSADESNPKAHVALAWVLWFHDRDWAATEPEIRRAQELNPSYATAHNLDALALTTRGRFPDALREVKRARELDPMSFLVSTDTGLVAYCARRYREATEYSQALLKIDPHFMAGHLLLGSCLLAEGRATAAVEEFALLADSDVETLGHLGYAQALAGDRPAALDTIARIQRMAAKGADPNFALAMVYTGLGDRDNALACLAKSAGNHDASVMYTGVYPYFESLHADPRFTALCKELRL